MATNVIKPKAPAKRGAKKSAKATTKGNSRKQVAMLTPDSPEAIEAFETFTNVIKRIDTSDVIVDIIPHVPTKGKHEGEYAPYMQVKHGDRKVNMYMDGALVYADIAEEDPVSLILRLIEFKRSGCKKPAK